jgi:hypothetical protein
MRIGVPINTLLSMLKYIGLPEELSFEESF